MNVWRAAADLIREGASGALATVARVRGSTPVPAGTKMLVGAEGRLIGSVGGGCVEAEVIAAAIAAELASRGHHVHLSTTDPAAHVAATLAGQLENLTISRIDPVAETNADRVGSGAPEEFATCWNTRSSACPVIS